MRHLVTRVERPAKSARRDGAEDAELELEDDDACRPPRTRTRSRPASVIDESESEAAPAAID